MLSNALDVHVAARQDRSSEWIHAALGLLRAFVEGLGSDLLMTEGDKDAYISRVVMEIIGSSEKLSSGQSLTKTASGHEALFRILPDLLVFDHPIISVQVAPQAVCSRDRDGSSIEVVLFNRLPQVSLFSSTKGSSIM